VVTPLYKLFLATRKEQGSAARSYEIVKRGVPKAPPTRQYIIVVIGKNETMLRNLEKPLKIYSFNGWQFVHWVEEICKDCIDAIRLHVFFRNIRPINVCAQAAIKRVKEGTIQIISHHDLDGKAAFRTLRKQI
jgi:hypothetical protein